MQRRASLERLRIMQMSRSALVYAVLLIAALIAIGPFVWAVSSSLKRQGELFVVPPVLIPPDPQWVNYVHVFDQIPLVRLFLNTAFYAGVVTVGQVAFCSLAGYGFARLAFAGRDKIFLAYLGTLMIPITVTLIPQYILMRQLGWVNTPWAMTVPGFFGSAFGTYLMRQFFLTLPRDLEDAATVDGANRWQIFYLVMLPLVRPALVVLGVLTWVSVWNDFLWPLIMLSDMDVSTLTLGLVRLQGQYYTNWPLLMAASVIAVAPLIAMYLLAQRAFVRGIATTGLGGL
jgi:multiple sugar transport system permease protein